MAIGPIQVIVFGFDRTDQFKGEVLQELRRLKSRGMIRVIDVFLAKKDAGGGMSSVEMSWLSEGEKVEFGSVVKKLLEAGGGPAATPQSGTEALELAARSSGISPEDLRAAIAAIPPGKALGVLLFVHTWAVPLRDAIRRAGGRGLAQGFITPEGLMMVGTELEAIAEAELAIEVSDAVRGAAILDALIAVEQAEEIKTAVAADVLRTLVVADMIEEAAIEDAVRVLAAADLIERKALASAELKAAAAGDEEVESSPGASSSRELVPYATSPPGSLSLLWRRTS
jgi:hypothetical protein